MLTYYSRAHNQTSNEPLAQTKQEEHHHDHHITQWTLAMEIFVNVCAILQVLV